MGYGTWRWGIIDGLFAWAFAGSCHAALAVDRDE